MIELAPSVDESDRVIDEEYGFKSIGEKVAFLRGMFDVEVVGHEKDEHDGDAYFAMLGTIINKQPKGCDML